MKRSRFFATLLLSCLLVGCGTAVKDQTSDQLPAADAGPSMPHAQGGTIGSAAPPSDAAATPPADDSAREADEGGADSASAVVTLPDSEDAICQVGAVSPCTCEGGMPGTRTCLSSEGTMSACGCASSTGPDVLVPPPPPVRYSCGGEMCGPYTEAETSVSARGCCTPEGACGSSSSFIFGWACVPRGGDPGQPSAKCPNEAPSFLDLYGCCRPDGQCGLSLDHVANFDVGCIERTEMTKLLNDGALERNILSFLFGTPIQPAAFKAVPCD